MERSQKSFNQIIHEVREAERENEVIRKSLIMENLFFVNAETGKEIVAQTNTRIFTLTFCFLLQAKAERKRSCKTLEKYNSKLRQREDHEKQKKCKKFRGKWREI